MTIRTQHFANGAYRVAKHVSVYSFGGWIECQKKWKFMGGAWRLVFQRGFTLNDTIVDGYNYNVYDVATGTGQWDGAMPVFANITVSGTLGSSVSTTYDWLGYVNSYPDLVGPAYSFFKGPVTFAKQHWYTNGIAEGRTMPMNVSLPAFASGNLPAGSVINLNIAVGSVLSGSGGLGGEGGTFNVRGNDHSYTPSTGGFPGGGAISTSVPTTIINNGIIGGGGGGGAGGGGATGNEAYDDPGAAGGGGAGKIGGQPGASYRTGSFLGQPGTPLAGGAGGAISNQGSGQWAGAKNGGAGGSLGVAGVNTPAVPTWAPYGFPGGSPGLAVSGVSNVVWQVLGDVRGATA
jgi:hypothetical protein